MLLQQVTAWRTWWRHAEGDDVIMTNVTTGQLLWWSDDCGGAMITSGYGTVVMMQGWHLTTVMMSWWQWRRDNCDVARGADDYCYDVMMAMATGQLWRCYRGRWRLLWCHDGNGDGTIVTMLWGQMTTVMMVMAKGELWRCYGGRWWLLWCYDGNGDGTIARGYRTVVMLLQH